MCAFDTQYLEDPSISSVGYQAPDLYAGQNRKDFVLTRDNWTCVYCGRRKVPLTVDHVIPRHPQIGPPGTDSVGNLVACCPTCQQQKGNLPLTAYLEKCQPDRMKRIISYISSLPKRNQSLSAAAHVGQVKTRLLQELGAQPTWGYVTKRNRTALGLTKSHDADAVAIAAMGRPIAAEMPPLRTYYVRRFAPGKGSRRQKYKANPLAKKRLHDPGLAPAFVGSGARARWVQRTVVNPEMATPAGSIRLRDLVETADGRVEYVMKLNSNRTVTLGKRPVGKEGQYSAVAGKIAAILRRRRGLLEELDGTNPRPSETAVLSICGSTSDLSAGLFAYLGVSTIV